jgi:hypothetical protein
MSCPRCVALTRFGSPCQSHAACKKYPGETKCRTHRQTTEQPMEQPPCLPELKYLQIYGAGQAASAQMKYVMASIDQWCFDADSVRRRLAFTEFVSAFNQVTQAVKEALTSDGTCLPEAGPTLVEDKVQLFQETGRLLFIDLKKMCPRGEWSWRFRPQISGHIELTCGGHAMPPELQTWLAATEDHLVEKTVFCRIPSLGGAFLASDVVKDIVGPAVAMVGAALVDSGADRMFREGQALANEFKVYVVSGPFVAVARRVRENEPTSPWWYRLGSAVGSAISYMNDTLIAGARAVISALSAAGRSTLHMSRLLLGLMQDHFVNMVKLMAAGTAAYALWAPMAALIAYGPLLAQLLLDPMAYIGAAALVAAHAAQQLGVEHGQLLYRSLVSILPALSQVLVTFAGLINWVHQTPRLIAYVPLPTSNVTALAMIGQQMMSAAPGFTVVDVQQLVAQQSWAQFITSFATAGINYTAIQQAVQAAPTELIANPQQSIPVAVLETGVATAAMSVDVSSALGSLQLLLPHANMVINALGEALSVGSMAMCLAGASTLFGLVSCAPVAISYLIAYRDREVVVILQSLGLSEEVARRVISVIKAGKAVLGALSIWQWWNVQYDMPYALANIPGSPEAIASEVAERGEALAGAAGQIITQAAGRGLRQAAKVARCVAILTSRGHVFLQNMAQMNFAADPAVLECLRNALYND